MRLNTARTLRSNERSHARVGELFERRAPRRARVVDEDVQPGLAGAHRRGELEATVLARQVGAERDTPTEAREVGGGGLACLELARREVDVGAGRQQPCGDHATDALPAAGDERDLAVQPEEALDARVANVTGVVGQRCGTSMRR